jgi:ADP-heptose:LPS heptosyltransferase
LAPLGDLLDGPHGKVTFYSLQKGAVSPHAAGTPPFVLRDLMAEVHDLADTAALIANLDLVICVDSALAHLTGALGRPVWPLIPLTPDWRWLLDRPDSPWYPTMRLFRQDALGAWGPVIDRVARQLREAIAGSEKGSGVHLA